MKHWLNLLLSLTSLHAVSRHSPADAGALRADMQCEKVAGPGRVVCTLTARASAGKLVWADALVVHAPAFAQPLRSRVTVQPAAAAEPGLARAKLALVAPEPGSGSLEVRVRAVVCREAEAGESCVPETLNVSAAVFVGQPAAALP